MVRRRSPLAESSLSDEVLWERAAGGNAFYAWVAAESSTVKTLRRYLIGERDLDLRYRQLHGLLVLNARPFFGIDAREGMPLPFPTNE